ncbi:MAG: cation transporter [Clostridia bacterium]|nr:cation transporter [Clostridia bacterium]
MKEINREKTIIRASAVSIAVNVILAGVKAALGVLSGSVAIISDAVNNLGDSSSSLITIAGTKLSKKKPDKKHPFGYGRIEYLTSLVIGIIVLVSGVEATISSVKLIIHPEEVSYSPVTIIIMAISVLAKIFLGIFLKGRGKAVSSVALTASGKDTMGDAVVTGVTIISIIIYKLTDVNLDAWAGALISLVIVKAGIETIVETISKILGERSDDELADKIYSHLISQDEILGVHDLILNDYGPEYHIGIVHVEIDHKKTLGDVYPMLHRLQGEIYSECNVLLTFGFYAVDKDSPVSAAVWEALEKFTADEEHCIGFHGIVTDEKLKTVFADLTLDFECDRHEMLGKATKIIAQKCPGYKAVINIDTEFSGKEYEYSANKKNRP